MKPKFEINKRNMVMDLCNQQSKFNMKKEEISKIRKNIFHLISSRERNLNWLEELNNLLRSQQNASFILNYRDEKLDGSFLHYLTLNSQAGDELVNFNLKRILFKFFLKNKHIISLI